MATKPKVFEGKENSEIIDHVYSHKGIGANYPAEAKAADQYFQLRLIESTKELTEEIKNFNKSSAELAGKLNLWTKILAFLTGIIAIGVIVDIYRLLEGVIVDIIETII